MNWLHTDRMQTTVAQKFQRPTKKKKQHKSESTTFTRAGCKFNRHICNLHNCVCVHYIDHICKFCTSVYLVIKTVGRAFYSEMTQHTPAFKPHSNIIRSFRNAPEGERIRLLSQFVIFNLQV